MTIYNARMSLLFRLLVSLLVLSDNRVNWFIFYSCRSCGLCCNRMCSRLSRFSCRLYLFWSCTFSYPCWRGLDCVVDFRFIFRPATFYICVVCQYVIHFIAVVVAASIAASLFTFVYYIRLFSGILWISRWNLWMVVVLLLLGCLLGRRNAFLFLGVLLAHLFLWDMDWWNFWTPTFLLSPVFGFLEWRSLPVKS